MKKEMVGMGLDLHLVFSARGYFLVSEHIRCRLKVCFSIVLEVWVGMFQG